jgi:hypothetical protein
VAGKIKTFLAEDEGLIGLIKSNPPFEKGNSGRIGCNGMAERCSFPANFWHLSKDIKKT